MGAETTSHRYTPPFDLIARPVSAKSSSVIYSVNQNPVVTINDGGWVDWNIHSLTFHDTQGDDAVLVEVNYDSIASWQIDTISGIQP
jgi:hypothetical protein